MKIPYWKALEMTSDYLESNAKNDFCPEQLDSKNITTHHNEPILFLKKELSITDSSREKIKGVKELTVFIML